MSSNTQRNTEAERVMKRRVRARREPSDRQPCEICGASAERHHIDYSDPDRVMWLCTAHHHQTHSQFGKPAPVDWMADIRAAMARIDAARVASRSGRAAQSGSSAAPVE